MSDTPGAAASAAQSSRTLSAVVITKNSEATLRRCLESLAFANEIVVVDSGSTDRTLEICREFGAKVHETGDWPGYGPQKNRAVERARCDWLLSVDSDEWVSDDLREELQHAMKDAGKPAYAIPRRSSFCGRFMRHSGWWPDYVVRLFARGRARFSDDLVHERLIVEGEVGKLRSPILHEAVTDVEQMLAKVNVYSTSGAQMKHMRGEGATLATALVHGAWTFFRTYVLRLGFLDGREGFLLAVLNAEGSYYRYVKLWLLSRKRGTEAKVSAPRQ